MSAFGTIANDYFQLQTVGLNLNGQPRLQGNFFLPLSLWKIRQNSGWLAALNADPTFDIDVTLDALDLGELTAAVNPPAKMSGRVSGRIELYGTRASLDGKSEMHLRNFVFDNAPALTGDIETRLAQSIVSFNANAITPGSDAVKLEGSLPLQLEKFETGHALKTDGPLSATLTFPATFLAKVPRYIAGGILTRGILSGDLTVSNSFQHPNIVGDVNLIDGHFLRGWSVATGLTFKGQTAAIDFVQLQQNHADVFARGEIDFHDPAGIWLKIFPSTSLLEPAALATGECVSGIEFSGATLSSLPSRPVHELDFSGSLFDRNWTISLPEPPDVASSRTFPFCFDDKSRGKTLTLQAAPSVFP